MLFLSNYQPHHYQIGKHYSDKGTLIDKRLKTKAVETTKVEQNTK